MTNDVTRFDRFVSTSAARIEAARTPDDFKQILTEAKALAAAARAAKNKEYEEMARSVEAKALNRLGRMMAEQRDAGLMRKAGRPGKKWVNEKPILASFGIDKNLANAARRAYPEGWPLRRSKPPRMTPDELEARGLSRATERYHVAGGGSVSRIKLIADELVVARAEIVRLGAENVRLQHDLDAIQSGHLMRLSQASLERRKALMAKAKAKTAVETAVDEKTKEGFERQIERLKGALAAERSKVQAFMVNGKRILDKDGWKAIRVCLHPDGTMDPIEKARREAAFKAFNAAVLEPTF